MTSGAGGQVGGSHPIDSPEVLARVTEGLPLVDIIARQLCRQLGRHAELDELVSQGREGLLSAARSFDPERGIPFRRWANIRVRGAMIDGVRAQGALPRRLYKQLQAIEAGDRYADGLLEEDSGTATASAEQADERIGVYLSGIATAMAMGLLEQGTSDGAASPADRGASAEELLARHELLSHARTAIAELPAPERALLERHYFDDVTFEDAAKELGLSKSWASRLHARGIEAVMRGLRRAKVLR
jgi:RNA polymerase sigma factor for flagellar operon FliA